MMEPIATEGGAEGDVARGGSISLAQLIDYIVQRTYDEHGVLAELLPTVGKAAAVEVLTLGTYSQLPHVDRERLVPPPNLTPAERRTTLCALAHCICQRVTTASLPSDVRNLKVENGRTSFTIGQEFSVSLTVMGDAPNLSWHLLDIAILIQDNETGEGKPLVHSSQLAQLRGVALARLAAAGLGCAIAALRYFCRSLSLELLYTQTLRLCRDRMSKHLQVDSYTPGEKLQVSYWRELGCELGYRLIIDAEGESLCVWHVPALSGSERVAGALSAHAPSMERLLAHTVHMRSRQRLSDLRVLLNELGVECSVEGLPCVLACSVLWPCPRGEQLLVSVGAHGGRLRAHVTAYQSAPRMPELVAALTVGDLPTIKTLLTQLRFWLVARRCEKTLQDLPASVCEHLPFLHGPDHPLSKLSQDRLYVTLHRHTNHILIVEMKEVAAGGTATTSSTSNSGSACSVALTVYLTYWHRCTPDECEDEGSAAGASLLAGTAPAYHVLRVCTLGRPDPFTPLDTADKKFKNGSAAGAVRAFLRLCTVSHLEPFTLTDGSFTPLDTPGMHPGKRKLSAEIARAVRGRQPAYFLPKLAHVVANADEIDFFFSLASELGARGVTFRDMSMPLAWSECTLYMRLVALPRPPGSGDPATTALLARLYAATIRLTTRRNSHTANETRVWTVEIVFTGSPVRTRNPKEQAERRCVFLDYKHDRDDGRTADAFLADWAAIVHLHTLLHDFMLRPAQERDTMWVGVSIRSYTYRSLVLGFGAGQRDTAVLQWSAASQRYTLATHALQPAANAHHCMHDCLDYYLNCHKDLMSIGVVLRETYAPLLALGRLPTLLHAHHVRTQMPTPTFMLLAHSWRKIRIIFAGAYSLEVCIRGGGIVTVRDSSYPKSDHSSVLDEFVPVQGLKAFLSLAEDDNPPSAMPPGPVASSATVSGSHVLAGGRGRAGATATPLSVGKLETLCTPCEPPAGAPSGPALAPLQRFLACVYMKRSLQRFVQQKDYLTMVSVETTSLIFLCEGAGLEARVALHPQHMQSLHLQLRPLPHHKDTWSADDLQVMEKFFDQRVAIAPYHVIVLHGWGRVFGAPAAALPSLVSLMRADLAPTAPALWQLQWALRIPPAAPQIVPAGQPAVLRSKDTLLIFICLTRGNTQLVLPLMYNMKRNVTHLAVKHVTQRHLIAVDWHLKRFQELNRSCTECTLWPAVRDLLTIRFRQGALSAPAHVLLARLDW